MDPRLLMIEVCKEDKINAPSGLVERLAKKLSMKIKQEIFPAKFRWDLYFGNEQNEIPTKDHKRKK